MAIFTSFKNEETKQFSGDSFREELFIKPLTNGHVYSYFQFTTVWNTSSRSNPYQHCHLFPRALGEIVTNFNVQELHISLTQGLWRHDKWGYPVHNGAPGAEVWVWFRNGTTNVSETWRKLTASLSGLLCASLNFLDDTNSISPQYSFRHAGVVSDIVDPNLLRYGTLPQEVVCTENLTPWKKLLPCNSKKGLASLLNAGYIHNTNYHSLGIHLREICRDKSCTKAAIELKQTVSLVYDLVILESGDADFSIRKLFGSGIPNRCPLAEESWVYIDVTNHNKNPLKLVPKPIFKTTSVRGGSQSEIAVYNLKEVQGMFNIAVTYKKKSLEFQAVRPPLIWANRFISGYGKQKGGIITKIFNKHWMPLNVIVLENIPWYVPVYLHTLKVVSNGMEINPAVIKYVPGRPRLNPTHLELILQLPPRSDTDISIEFDYVFLKWQEYPPDASHGFYIGSSVITSWLPMAKNYTGIPQDESYFGSSFNASRDGYLVRLRTESMIITLPTPDFSMPYNVICLVCTVVALAFGPMHNITTKKLRISKDRKPQGLLIQLMWKVWKAVKGKNESDKEEEQEERENDEQKSKVE
ncbi:hypothetical protein RUM43_009574 [Polyplax serrata]|uniref:GPI transamidase component PIG-T n=1 Tax=Polyplax serrata TaxID=468196 RepID=A0AAN8PD93_POLSC